MKGGAARSLPISSGQVPGCTSPARLSTRTTSEHAEAEHSAIPARRSNSSGAPGTRHSGERFSVVAIPRARDQNGLIHGLQQRNVVRAIAETHSARARSEGTAEPADHPRHGDALVILACDMEEAAASRRSKALALDLFP